MFEINDGLVVKNIKLIDEKIEWIEASLKIILIFITVLRILFRLTIFGIVRKNLKHMIKGETNEQ